MTIYIATLSNILHSYTYNVQCVVNTLKKKCLCSRFARTQTFTSITGMTAITHGPSTRTSFIARAHF